MRRCPQVGELSTYPQGCGQPASHNGGHGRARLWKTCGRGVETSSVTVGCIRLTGKRDKRRLLQTFARSQVPNHGAAARATEPRTS